MVTPSTGSLRVSLLAAVAVLLAPAAARSAGFEFGPQGVQAVGRGGAITAGVSDPSAIWLNPARLSLLRGTNFLYNHTVSILDLEFDRAPAQRCEGGPGQTPCVPSGYPTAFPRDYEQENIFPSGMSLGLTSDFGLKNWTFGLGLNGPASFGKVAYANNAPNEGETLPMASASRYSVTKMDAMIAFVSLAAAYKYQDLFGIGVTAQYVAVPWIRYQLDIIGPNNTDTQNQPTASRTDMQVDLDMADWTGVSGILGMWMRPAPCFEVAAAARVVPIQVRTKGDLTISGTPNSLYAKSSPVKVPGRLSFDYPMDLRIGLRYVHRDGDREVFDIEADYVWEQWSVLDAFRVKFDREDVEAFGASLALKSITLDRNFKDTYSVRLGGTYNPVPDHLWLRWGGWWESAAQPDAYTTTDLPSWDRFGVGLGLAGAWRGLGIGISYAHVFQLDRTVSAGEGRVYQQVLDFEGRVNPGYAINEGRYRSSFDIVSVGLTIQWDELISGRKR